MTDDQPLISVVVPSVSGWPALVECLDSLMNQVGDLRVEVLVVDRCGAAIEAAFCQRFPDVQVISVAGQPSIPAMRAVGAEQARGQVIAFTEDSCVAHPHWFRTIAEAHAAGRMVVGGPVEKGGNARGIDWARYFCEYARFMPPLEPGPAAGLSGNNSAYDRRLLDQLVPALRAGLWEPFLQGRLRASGIAFHAEPDMIVFHARPCAFGDFLGQRFHYSRSFAGMRLQGRPWWVRLAYACACAVLPLLLLARLLVVMMRKRRRVRRFVTTLPLLCVCLLAWAVGEAVGALAGPGHSAGRVA